MPFYTETSIQVIDDCSDSNQGGCDQGIGIIHEDLEENSILVTDQNKLELCEQSVRASSARGYDSMSRNEEMSIFEDEDVKKSINE